MPTPVLLSCSDPLDGRRPDPHFMPETRAARDLGATVGLVDHDALLAGYPGDAVRRVPTDAGPAWYRGWMIPSARYAALEAALAERGTPLRITAGQYRSAHELPGWYEHFADMTPRSGWVAHEPDLPLPDPELAALADGLIAAGATGAIVKDYVKSAKHRWATACYVPDLTDRAALTRVVAAFLAEQAGFLAGGIVLREFEDFTAPDGQAVSAQARVWWLDGRPILVTAHPDTPRAVVEPDLSGLADRVRALPARFLTTDLVRRDDGAWRVVEVGDGQVSGLPTGGDPGALLTHLVGPDRPEPPPEPGPAA
jgi:hypothetical protein